MSSDDESGASAASASEYRATAHATVTNSLIEDADDDTFRIMLSTDNHVGFMEDDPVRGNDSFAALEEVLFLARNYRCDFVLLAGDLFHENKPSRRTLIKTIEIFRRYCFGPNAVSVEILSDQSKNFRSGQVNYANEFFSVDLPVMSIHGNHDDPSREGQQLYAALDLLDCASLVNYIGRQDDINSIQISPILMKKGGTHLALYALGSMRDARLNRMWQGSKVTFLQPVAAPNTDGGVVDQDTTPKFFNLFALHQNRDKGRGSKNCVHEAMIPEWMDLVCWGHEHECCIEPQESVVGTFRISQPGSSVATSLVAGEAVRKQVGILDIRGSSFRLRPIPLTQVRTFVMGEMSLREQQNLDPDDPKIEQKIKRLLKEQVELLIHQAKGKARDLNQAAQENGNLVAQATVYPLSNELEKPGEVIVRLKVEHSGFFALNNQRFGAQFVGQVANPNDILLFQRKKAPPTKFSNVNAKIIEPVVPDQMEEMNIEAFINGELERSNCKMELFDEKRLATALDDYVQKQQVQAIAESVGNLVTKQQKKLIHHGPVDAQDPNENPRHTEADSKEDHSTFKVDGDRRAKLATSPLVDRDVDTQYIPRRGVSMAARLSASKRTSNKTTKGKNSHPAVDVIYSDDDEPMPKSLARPGRAKLCTGNGRKVAIDIDVSDDNDDDDDDDDEYIEEASRPKRAPAPTRRGRVSTKNVLDALRSDDSLNDEAEEIDNPSPPTRAASKRNSRKSSAIMSQTSKPGTRLSQSQLSFAPVKRGGNSRKRAHVNIESDDDDTGALETTSNSYELDEDWGTAKTDTFRS